jgi:hypothetical protein
VKGHLGRHDCALGSSLRCSDLGFDPTTCASKLGAIVLVEVPPSDPESFWDETHEWDRSQAEWTPILLSSSINEAEHARRCRHPIAVVHSFRGPHKPVRRRWASSKFVQCVARGQ